MYILLTLLISHVSTFPCSLFLILFAYFCFLQVIKHFHECSVPQNYTCDSQLPLIDAKTAAANFPCIKSNRRQTFIRLLKNKTSISLANGKYFTRFRSVMSPFSSISMIQDTNMLPAIYGCHVSPGILLCSVSSKFARDRTNRPVLKLKLWATVFSTFSDLFNISQHDRNSLP